MRRHRRHQPSVRPTLQNRRRSHHETTGGDVAQAKAEEVLDVPVTLRAPAGLRGKQPVTFVVASDDGQTVREVESNFFGPM